MTARRGVVLCAGAFMTPKLLMLSGLWPADHLRANGVPVVADIRAVGANYQDHVVIPFAVRLRWRAGFVGHYRGIRALRHSLQWYLYRSGPLSSTVVEAGGFFDLDRDGRPEIQIGAAGLDRHGRTLRPCRPSCAATPRRPRS
jgi:choline dehydrogenase